MGKGEGIKKAFLGNAAIQKVVPDKVYKDRLDASITEARASLEAAKSALERLPADNGSRKALLANLDPLHTEVAAEEAKRGTDAAGAWMRMQPLVERAAARSAHATRHAEAAKRTIAQVDRRVAALRALTAQMREDRRDTLNDRAAARLEKQITGLEGRIDQTLTAAKSDPDAAMSTLDDLEGEAQLLGGGTRIAITATPEGQRKVTRQTTDAVLGALSTATQGQANNRMGQLLAQADTEPDQYGQTLKDQIKSVLNVFDDQFAVPEHASPDAARDNTAMRVVAMANAMALRLVKQRDINDPALKPVVARSIVQEYGAELARAIAGQRAQSPDAKAMAAEEAKAQEALKLAEAMLADDPVLKVFTGKINGPDAVEAIRKQADKAGIAPSRMLALQRQQLEMRVGSLTMPAVEGGELNKDLALKVNAQGQMLDKDGKPVDDPAKQALEEQGFILKDLYGELSPDDLQRLVSYRQEKEKVEAFGTKPTLPVMKATSAGGGLEYQPTGKQMHQVRRGDTVTSVAKQLCAPGADDKAVQARIEDIKKLNKFVFWTAQGPQTGANDGAQRVLKGKVPLAEQRERAPIETFLPDKALPVGAVLTVQGSSGVLDQLAGYVAAWDTPALPDPPVDTDRLSREQFKESLNIRAKLGQTQERQETGKVEPKVTPDALAQAASRLLPPLRPEVTHQFKSLVAQLKALDDIEAEKKQDGALLSAEQLQQRKALKEQRDTLKGKLETFRDLAAHLATQLKSQTRAEVEQSDEFTAYEALRQDLADAAYRLAPGLGQDHGWGGTLQDARADGREAAVDVALQRQARIKALTEALKNKKISFEKEADAYAELARLVGEQEKARDAERVEGREGAMNERQYAHLKLLDRWDQEEKERFQAETGESVEEFVVRRLSELLKIDKGAARRSLEKAFVNVSRVPLTITFRAESLFSDSAKDEPAHGTAYVSDAVYTRKDVAMKDLIGRGTQAQGKVAVTGGQKTQTGKDGQEDVEASWSAGRGKNYMRWRTDKDDREAHQDRLPFKDQQIFGAANPNWEKTRGGTKDEKPDGSVNPGADVPVSANYYGNAHFLLKDAVRKRVAYITRGQNSQGGGQTAFQRKDFLMLFHDMIKGHDVNQRYLKALLTIGESDYVATSIAWEFHLYGGFDIRNDAQEIHLADVVDPGARGRIERFAAKHGIKVAGGKPQGVGVVHDGNAAKVDVGQAS